MGEIPMGPSYIERPEAVIGPVRDLVEPRAAGLPFGGPGPASSSMTMIADPPRESQRAIARAAHSLFDGLSAQMAVLDEEGCILDTNRAWHSSGAAGAPFCALLNQGDNLLDFLASPDTNVPLTAGVLYTGMQSVLQARSAEFSHEFTGWDDGTNWFAARIVAIEGVDSDSSEGGARAIVSFENISERRLAEENLRRSNAILEATQEAAAEGIFLVDHQGLVVRFNRRFVELWGIDPNEVKELQQTHQLLTKVLDSLKDPDEFIERIGYLYDHPSELARDEIYLKDGRVLDRYSAPAVSPEGDYYGRVWSFSDISARKAAESRLAHQAFHDPLTGLPNRALFADRLDRALSRACRQEQYIAVLFLDLDRFKLINDSLGHDAGDQLLVAVAQRLRLRMRPEDTAARLGGDEFTILLEDIEDVNAAARVAERIAEDLRAPFIVGSREVFTTSSIGIALSDGKSHAADELMRDADAAMYLAKSRGKAHYEIFEETLTNRALEHLELENDMRRALRRGEFELYYQPIVNLKSGRQEGFEALLRWKHPTRGFITPDSFIPLAEETGLIISIGSWVLSEACLQCKSWMDAMASSGWADQRPPRISVNLSARQFEQPNLVADVAASLRESELPPYLLLLEITESVVMRDIDSALETLRALKALGVGLAIDDFGTGHSSLSYLQRFPIDILKIDRSFVMGLSRDEPSGNEAIVRAIITLAENFSVRVTAEGIETPDQLSLLLEMNCQYGQGYFFARPCAAGEINLSLSATRNRVR